MDSATLTLREAHTQSGTISLENSTERADAKWGSIATLGMRFWLRFCASAVRNALVPCADRTYPSFDEQVKLRKTVQEIVLKAAISAAGVDRAAGGPAT